MSVDVAAIAASLTEIPPPIAEDGRMKVLIVALSKEWSRLAHTVFPRRATTFVMPARRLKKRGLVESRQDRNGVVYWRLTLLGEEVRQHFSNESRNSD